MKSKRGVAATAARRVQGEQRRREVVEIALKVASLEGLEGLTIGRLAGEVGMSKAGLFDHFGSKEAIQLATVDAAFQHFLDEVVAPAQQARPGLSRLRSYVDHYFEYVARRSERGGCFFTSAALEFDDRPGEVRERLVAFSKARTALIEETLREAIAGGHLRRGIDVAQLAFEVTTCAIGAAVEFQLLRDPECLARAKRAFKHRLEELRA
jgi:AcrR family transcriptional regulator